MQVHKTSLVQTQLDAKPNDDTITSNNSNTDVEDITPPSTNQAPKRNKQSKRKGYNMFQQLLPAIASSDDVNSRTSRRNMKRSKSIRWSRTRRQSHRSLSSRRLSSSAPPSLRDLGAADDEEWLEELEKIAKVVKQVGPKVMVKECMRNIKHRATRGAV